MFEKHGETKKERIEALKEAIKRSESKKVKWPTVSVSPAEKIRRGY